MVICGAAQPTAVVDLCFCRPDHETRLLKRQRPKPFSSQRQPEFRSPVADSKTEMVRRRSRRERSSQKGAITVSKTRRRSFFRRLAAQNPPSRDRLPRQPPLWPPALERSGDREIEYQGRISRGGRPPGRSVDAGSERRNFRRLFLHYPWDRAGLAVGGVEAEVHLQGDRQFLANPRPPREPRKDGVPPRSDRRRAKTVADPDFADPDARTVVEGGANAHNALGKRKFSGQPVVANEAERAERHCVHREEEAEAPAPRVCLVPPVKQAAVPCKRGFDGTTEIEEAHFVEKSARVAVQVFWEVWEGNRRPLGVESLSEKREEDGHAQFGVKYRKVSFTSHHEVILKVQQKL